MGFDSLSCWTRASKGLKLAHTFGSGAVLPRLCKLLLDRHLGREKLMEWRIDQPDGDRQAGHCPEKLLEVGLLHRKESIESELARLESGGKNHGANVGQAIWSEEHVLGAAEADSRCLCIARPCGVLRRVGVRVHRHGSGFSRPGEQFRQREIRWNGLDAQRQPPEEDTAGRAVEREPISFPESVLTDARNALGFIDQDSAGSRDAALAHSARDHGGMACGASGRSKKTNCRIHPVDVVGGRLLPDEDDRRLLVFACKFDGPVGAESHPADRGTGRCRQSLGNRPQTRGAQIELPGRDGFNVSRLHSPKRVCPRDEPFLRHLDSGANRCQGASFRRSGLQQEQIAIFDGKFKILHIAIVRLELRGDGSQLLVDRRHGSLKLGDRHRRTNAGNDVLSLRVGQEFTKKLVGAGRRIAGKANPRATLEGRDCQRPSLAP